MTYEATRHCPVNITFGDGQRTPAKAGKGLRITGVVPGAATVVGTWQGDPQSVVTIKQHHFSQAFVRVG